MMYYYTASLTPTFAIFLRKKCAAYIQVNAVQYMDQDMVRSRENKKKGKVIKTKDNKSSERLYG